MLRRVHAVAVLLFVASGAHAACVPQSDDPGCFTTDPVHSKCEQKVGRNAANLAKAILKCHQKMATTAVQGRPFDEEACEATAAQKFLDKTDVTNCPCVSESSLAMLWESVLDDMNGTLYCDAGGPLFGDDDAGRVPVSEEEAACEGRLSRCAAKLVRNYTKCHASAAKAAVKGAPFDEEACEHGPIPGKPGAAAIEKYDACVAKALAKGGCDGCENPPAMLSAIDEVVDGANNLVYCMDQPAGSCVSTYQFTAASSSVDEDIGWTGHMHDQPQTTNVRLTLALSGCANASPPCGTCNVSGPITNGGGATFANRRCRGDDTGANGSWIQCTGIADCPGTGNACVFFLGPPKPLVAAGFVPLCIVNTVVGNVSGTVDPDSGASAFGLALNESVHVGPTFADPCPRCVSGTCDSGARSGMPCVVSGASALFDDDVSFDCPPSHGALIPGALGVITTTLSTGAQTATLTAASPACTAPGFTGSQCLCQSCDDAAWTPCFTNADCVAVGATTCGSKRCVLGPNNDAPCAVNSECPGGVCKVPGEPTRPNQCDDAICTPNTPPDDDSVDEGTCAGGPFERFCNIDFFRQCVDDDDCFAPGDTCGAGRFRECYTDNGVVGAAVSVGGVASPVTPTLGGLFCVRPGSANALNIIYGLPGLGRVTIPGIVVVN